MSRRGILIEFYSDNGTNFIGAERKLRDAVKDVESNIFVKTFTSATTKWNFNPPFSPHMGENSAAQNNAFKSALR